MYENDFRWTDGSVLVRDLYIFSCCFDPLWHCFREVKQAKQQEQEEMWFLEAIYFSNFCVCLLFMLTVKHGSSGFVVDSCGYESYDLSHSRDPLPCCRFVPLVPNDLFLLHSQQFQPKAYFPLEVFGLIPWVQWKKLKYG